MAHPFRSYEIVERIAVGGMAEVFRANAFSQNGSAVPVVIKRILPQYADDEAFRDLFVSEARVASKLRHPNIVRMLDLGRMDKHLFIALEYIDGADLFEINEFLKAAGQPVTLAESVYIAVEVLKGLQHAHTADEGIVHRDLSPANVMITRTGSVKVTDFGIAKSRFRSVQTIRGILKGNVRYMAPEQITGEDEIDARTDVYQVGLLLWTLIAGRHPFQGLAFGEAIDRTVKGAMPQLADFRAGVPEEILFAIGNAMERLPELRFSSALEFQTVLEAAARTAGVELTGDALAVRIVDFKREGIEQKQVVSRTHVSEGDISILTIAGEEGSLGSLRAESLPGVRLQGHEAEVTSLAVTPDGMLALTGSSDRTGRVWDLVAKREVHVLLGHHEPIIAVDLSGSGTVGVTIDTVGELRVWHLESGEEIWQTQAHKGGANAVVLTPDGRVAVTGGDDGIVKIWDLHGERLVAPLQGKGAITSLALASDGRFVAAGLRDGTVRVYDIGRRSVFSATSVGDAPVLAVAVATGGRLTLAASGRRVFVCEGGTPQRAFERHTDAVTAVALAPAGHAVSAGRSGMVKLWNVQDTSEVRMLKAHEMPVLALRVLSDGSLFSACADGSIGVWQIPQRRD